MITQRALTVEDICNKLRPVFGTKIDDIYLRYAMAGSREEKDEIAQILNALYSRNLNKLLDREVLLEPPIEGVIDGDYNLASVSYAKKKLFPFSLREKDWPRHVCVSGMSGSGKTTLAFKIIESFIAKDKNFLVFDWKKSFRPLIKADSDIMIFTIGNEAVSNLFKVNINRPPKGVNPKEWINVLCDLLTESFFVSFGVHKVLLETLDEAFKEWGIYEGSKNYPTWNHIKWRLEEKMGKVGGREAGWLESALRIATVLTFGDFGNVLNYKGEDSIALDDLLDKKVVVELNSLGNIEKKFFCEFILTYIYKMKKAREESVSLNGKFDHAILVDEAHNIFLKDKTHFVQESVTDMIYREMREYGTSLICLDQHISKLSDTVKGNSACHIAFQQQLPQDIFDISNLMQVADRKEMFSQLPVGSAIVRLSERFNMPFLVEVDQSELRKGIVTDEDVKNRMHCLMTGKKIVENPDSDFSKAARCEIAPVVVSEPEVSGVTSDIPSEMGTDVPSLSGRFNDIQANLLRLVERKLKQGMSLGEIEKELGKGAKLGAGYRISDVIRVVNHVFDKQFKENLGSIKLSAELGVEPEAESDEGLSEDHTGFLRFLRANPEHNLSTVEVYKEVGVSARKGTKIKKELTDMGLLKIQEVKYDKGWKKLIRLA
jgi:hypothetical protein